MAMLMLVIVALLGQSVVTGSHVHAFGVALSPPVAHAVPTTTGHQRPGHTPADCPLCREMAQAGHYISPAPILLAVSGRPPLWIARVAGRRLIDGARWLGWRSRAPPCTARS